jgi:magnesium transporter
VIGAVSPSSNRTCLVRTGHEVRALSEDEHHRIDEFVADPHALVWLDIVDPTPDDLELLVREFGVHHLAIEDLRNRGQRAKLDTYDDRHVVVAYEAVARNAGPEGDAADVTFAELHLFAGPGYLVTARWAPSPAIEVTRGRFERRAEVVGSSVGGLLYAILDAVVDGYLPVIDALNDRLDELQPALLMNAADQESLHRLLSLKRTMLKLRHVAAPLREVANALLRREAALIDDEAAPYYNDLFDHLVRVLDSLDLLRDLGAVTLEANLAATNNSLNQVVKRLTAVTVILMIPTLIAGIYGMNFEFMPELEWVLGYPFALGLMVVAVLVALTYFRRHDWF